MLQSHTSYCCPIKMARVNAKADRISCVDRLRRHVRVYAVEGHDAVMLTRDGVTEPVPVWDLTMPELHRLLDGPASYGVML